MSVFCTQRTYKSLLNERNVSKASRLAMVDDGLYVFPMKS